jgi:hypothetical protein
MNPHELEGQLTPAGGDRVTPKGKLYTSSQQSIRYAKESAHTNLPLSLTLGSSEERMICEILERVQFRRV